jgi:four helix bundle protein
MTAEAWARRTYPASFVNKLVEAIGEAMETQSWLDYALDCNYISAEQHEVCDDQWRQVGAMLAGMVEKADAFCGKVERKRLAGRSRK